MLAVDVSATVRTMSNGTVDQAKFCSCALTRQVASCATISPCVWR